LTVLSSAAVQFLPWADPTLLTVASTSDMETHGQTAMHEVP